MNKSIWLVVWNMFGIFPFSVEFHNPSSQLTKSYFSEGFNPPSSHGIDEIYPIIHHYIQIISKNILENNVDKNVELLHSLGLVYLISLMNCGFDKQGRLMIFFIMGMGGDCSF